MAIHSPWPLAAVATGARVISELEFGANCATFPLLAITGTNGKSSLVKFCADAMQLAGLRAEPCGNYGIPLCEVLGRDEDLDWGVVEVSSFQLELAQQFRPRVAILLNLQPDHLDRHGDMATYRSLKARMFTNMAEGDVAVVPYGEEGDHLPVAAAVSRLTFGDDAGADLVYSTGLVEERRTRRSVIIGGGWFDNPVFGVASAAATGALRACGLSDDQIGSAFASFSPLPHRMQHVEEHDGICFIDDSK